MSIYNQNGVHERQQVLIVVCGETGVGKTYTNHLEINNYVKGNPRIKREGRKVLAFDVNDDDYTSFPTAKISQIQNMEEIIPKRIRPYTKTGGNMLGSEKRALVKELARRFKKGMLVLDDIDKYMTGARGQDMKDLLTTNRHNDIDIMISHQSLAKVSTTEWENITWLRLHHQVDDISRYENRIPNYFIVCIATYIIDENYDKANYEFSRGRINEQEYKARKGFCVLIDMRTLRIRGVSKYRFIRAAKKFIDHHQSRKVRMLLQERDFKNKPVYKNRNAAIMHLVDIYLRNYEPNKTARIFQ